MRLSVEGWDRVTQYGRRDILTIDIPESISKDVYDRSFPYTGSHVSLDGAGIRIRSRLHLDTSMGGNYKAEVFISKTDILWIFLRVFRDFTLNQITHMFNGGELRGLTIGSLWKGSLPNSEQEAES